MAANLKVVLRVQGRRQEAPDRSIPLVSQSDHRVPSVVLVSFRILPLPRLQEPWAANIDGEVPVRIHRAGRYRAAVTERDARTTEQEQRLVVRPSWVRRRRCYIVDFHGTMWLLLRMLGSFGKSPAAGPLPSIGLGCGRPWRSVLRSAGHQLARSARTTTQSHGNAPSGLGKRPAPDPERPGRYRATSFV